MQKIPPTTVPPRTPQDPPHTWGSAALDVYMREDFTCEPAGRGLYVTRSEMEYRIGAMTGLKAEGEPWIKAEDAREATLFEALTVHGFDAARIPKRGTSFGDLSSEARDGVATVIRTNPKLYGFADEGDATKWLASTKVVRGESTVGLGIRTGSSLEVAGLAHRTY